MGRYQAITFISHPRKGDPNRETDLIYPGDTLDLTDEEAALYLPPRRVPAVIRASAEAGEPLPRLHPKQLSGVAVNPRTGRRVGQPGPPDGARPDPAGSSAVQVLEPPEANEPQPDSQNQPPADDAVDLPPRRSRAATPRTR